MLWLFSLARAEPPWDCPTVVTPADAEPWREADFGVPDVLAAVEAAAMVWWDDACAWVETTTDDGVGTVTVERVCTTAQAEVRSYVVDYAAWPYVTSTHTTLEVTTTADTWTYILVETYVASDSGSTWGSVADESSAEWAGAIEGLPDDGTISEYSLYTSYGGDPTYDSRSVTTPTCAASWRVDSEGGNVDETVSFSPGTSVRVRSGNLGYLYMGYCPDTVRGAFALVDGVMYGAVDRTTWEDDLSDADRDGFAPTCDCDDADPTLSPYLDDTPNDGIDQDCSGSDLVDWDADNDGYDAPEFGGDDCDETTRAIHPGAPDEPGDGVDTDCDGANDVDVDGDGYTADGDDDPADCDDTLDSIHPGAEDIVCDGIDQDCDGTSSADADGDGYTCADEGGPDCDDTDAAVSPDGLERYCSGVDEDCDGSDPCPPPDATGEEESAGEPIEEGEEEEAGCTYVPAPLWLAVVGLWGRRRRGSAG